MHTKCAIHKTTDYQLTESDSGGVFSNRLVLNDITYTLPDNASKGVFFTFAVQEEFSLNILPGNVLDFIINRNPTIPGQAIYADAIGESTTLVSDGNRNWIITIQHGLCVGFV